ncbi:TIGR02677 family protein [Nocardia sp. NPDC057668]|uniref:TIGR02677 family protein n=1 Tax=Nocardia sp. NPDC057668 TaxID=3346202 RepID=UPI003670DEF9
MPDRSVGGTTLAPVYESADGLLPGPEGVRAEEFPHADRLRLFSFATAEKRGDYLWVLRAFDIARGAYVVLLHASDVVETLGRCPGAPELTPTEVGPLLEQLHQWGVLERSYDGTRAATLAEYRNRHFVYQFSQAGFQAFRAVSEVLEARLDEASLSRLVLPELLADLHTLAEANRTGDSPQVYRVLARLDRALSDLAERAAHFYLTLGDLVRTTEATPEAFLAHKDALLAHMREFSMDLARFAPRLAAAIRAVEDTGVDELIERAAHCDERVLLNRAERQEDWRARWQGLRSWFVNDAGEGGITECDRLREATMSAIAAVLSLLRRVTETRKGGVSRESALRHLAGWFTAAPSADAAHALFDAVFGLGRPRHLAMQHPDADVIPAIRSWWDAPPLEIARTLAETGRPPTPGAPARLQRNDAGIRRLRQTQLDSQRARARAAASLAASDIHERELDEGETEVLLRLLDAASTAWVPVSGRVPGTTGSDSGVTLTVSECEGSTAVRTARGLLHLNNRRLQVRDTAALRKDKSGSPARAKAPGGPREGGPDAAAAQRGPGVETATGGTSSPGTGGTAPVGTGGASALTTDGTSSVATGGTSPDAGGHTVATDPGVTSAVGDRQPEVTAAGSDAGRAGGADAAVEQGVR